MPISPQILELIRSSNIEDRKKAVKALARTEDREALRYLASIYKEDSDPEVRDLALKAGQHIKKRGELAEWGSDQGKAVGKFQDVEIKRNSPKQRNTLPDNAKTREAKALMDKAMDLMMQSNYAEAQDLAYQAFEIVPNLDTESYYASLAGDIMGLPQAEAIAALREGRPDYAVAGKAKRKRGAEKEVSWTDFLVDTAILYVIAAAPIVFIMVIIFNQLQGLAESGLFSSGYSEYGTVDPTAEIASFLSTSGMTIAIIIGLMIGLIMVLMNLLHFVILHFCAGMLGGDGSFRALVHKSVIPIATQSLLSLVISGASYYFSFQALISANGDSDNLMTMSQTDNMLNSLNGLSILIGLGYALWISYIIGKNYDFGFGKGCGTLIISSIVFGIALCGCIFMFSMMLSDTASLFY